MSEQEIPVQDQEEPLFKEYSVPVATPEGGAHRPEPAIAPPREQYARPTPPPFVPPVQPSWSGHSPGTRPAWAGQPGPIYPYYYPRRRSRWPWIVLTMLLLFMLLIGGVFFLFSFVVYPNSVTETRNFSVSANPTLVLNNDTGSIHVRADPSGQEVTIQATKHSGLWGNLNDIRVSYTQNPEANTVTVNVDRQSNFSLFTSTSVEFEVTVPDAATLQLKTNTGSIDVSGVSGEMVLLSNTGSIEASDGTLSGNSELRTNTGSITFNGALDRSGTYRFETNTGSVNVTLPSESMFHVDASTDTGSINTTFSGVTVQHHQTIGADAHGDVGSSPQATVTLRTNTGSINLYQW